MYHASFEKTLFINMKKREKIDIVGFLSFFACGEILWKNIGLCYVFFI